MRFASMSASASLSPHPPTSANRYLEHHGAKLLIFVLSIRVPIDGGRRVCGASAFSSTYRSGKTRARGLSVQSSVTIAPWLSSASQS